MLAGAARWTPERGTPQGAVISPLLANLYLDPLDQLMAERGYESYRDFRDAFARAVTPADKLSLTDAYAQVDPNLCTGCGRCVKVGHCYAISMKDDKAVIVPGDCTGCSTCMDVCPVGAISFVEKK